MTTMGMISIWFFIGCLLLIYSLLILAAGIQQPPAPKEANVAMRDLHLQLYWGIVMLALALVYLIGFRPRS
jgi:hypothetical protein